MKAVAVVAAVQRIVRAVRRVPKAYSLGPLILLLGALLLVASLDSELRVVDVATAIGEAPPGTTERLVPFNVTPLFRVNATVASCRVELHLLSDSEYTDFSTTGALPSPTVDCRRTEALVAFPARHLVVVNGGSMNASYGLVVAFLGFISPYVVLSLPGAAAALAAIVWITMTMLGRGTERIREDIRRRADRLNEKGK